MAAPARRIIRPIVAINTKIRYNLRKKVSKVPFPKTLPLLKTKKIKKKAKKITVKRATSVKRAVQEPIVKTKQVKYKPKRENKVKKIPRVSSLRKRVIKMPNESFVQMMLSSLKLKCEKPKNIPSNRSRKLTQSKPKPKSLIGKNSSLPKKPKQATETKRRPEGQLKRLKPPAKQKIQSIKRRGNVVARIDDPYDSNTVENISEKLSPIPKTKKYLGKSILQIQKEQQKQKRLCLIKGEKKQGLWILYIAMNTTGKVYSVRIDKSSLKCNCINFRMTKKCEQITFVSGKVLQNDELIHHLKYKNEISEELFDKISKQLSQRLFFYLAEEPQSKGDSTIFERRCFICFDSMETEEQVEKCHRCDIKFHKKCFEVFGKSHNQCLFCHQGYYSQEEKEKLIQALEQVNV